MRPDGPDRPYKALIQLILRYVIEIKTETKEAKQKI